MTILETVVKETTQKTSERELQDNIKNIKENPHINKGVVNARSCNKCKESQIKHFDSWTIILKEQLDITKEEINGRLFVENYVCGACVLSSGY